VGEPVSVTRIRYLGQPRIGLLATCQCGERTYEVSLADVVFPHASAGARLVARYRAWLGFDAVVDLEQTAGPSRPQKIGALSLGTSFEGVLSGGHIDNRPFLRCLHGTGISAWRLGDRRSAAAVFKRLLWLSPGDNQGARFNLAAVEAGKTWDEMDGDER
jgi:hypothetical protein